MAKEPRKIKKRVEEPVSPRRRVNNIPIGKEYGEWTVLGLGKKPDYLLCRCSCGVEREVHAYSLPSGKSQSCGHLRKLKVANEST